MQSLLLPAGRSGGAPPVQPSSFTASPFPGCLGLPRRPTQPYFSRLPQCLSPLSSHDVPSLQIRHFLSSPSKSLSSSHVALLKRPTALAAAPVSPAYSSSDDSEKAKLAQVAKRLDKTARYFKRLGSFGFWGQLVCTVVAAAILSFSVIITGKITSPATFYATAGGIVAAFVSVFWSFGYIRLSEKLRRTANDPSKAPPRADVVKSLRNGIVLNVLGIGAAILGMQATVGILVAKALTTSVNPYQGLPAGSNPVLALDVFLVQASANTILSHFLGLVSSLELLRSVTVPPSESTTPVPRVA